MLPRPNTDRRQAMTHESFAAYAEGIVERLRARTCLRSAELVVQGEQLITEFRKWSTSPPVDTERGSWIGGLADWARMALELLAHSERPKVGT